MHKVSGTLPYNSPQTLNRATCAQSSREPVAVTEAAAFQAPRVRASGRSTFEINAGSITPAHDRASATGRRSRNGQPEQPARAKLRRPVPARRPCLRLRRCRRLARTESERRTCCFHAGLLVYIIIHTDYMYIYIDILCMHIIYKTLRKRQLNRVLPSVGVMEEVPGAFQF